MNPSVITAVISGAAALVVAAMSYALSKRREREAEWRKVKLEHYREYIAGLSGIVNDRATPASQARYSDAVNALFLVAPGSVLRALRTFQKEIAVSNKNRSDERHDALLSELVRAIRLDIHPGRVDDSDLSFQVLGVPPREDAV
jgi:hypothetical protein